MENTFAICTARNTTLINIFNNVHVWKKLLLPSPTNPQLKLKSIEHQRKAHLNPSKSLNKWEHFSIDLRDNIVRTFWVLEFNSP